MSKKSRLDFIKSKYFGGFCCICKSWPTVKFTYKLDGISIIERYLKSMCLLSSFSSFHILDIRNGKVFRYERIVKHVQKYDEELEETWDSDYTTNGDNMSCFWNDADEQLQKSREREHEDKDGRGRRKNGGLKNDNRRARGSKYE